jgi:hypothetical protein
MLPSEHSHHASVTFILPVGAQENSAETLFFDLPEI